MSLYFQWREISQRPQGLTFDDVLIVPTRSDVKSRRDPDLSSHVTRRFRLDTPIVSANMDTVTGSDMAIAMAQLGGLGILHRFMSVEEQVIEIQKMKVAGVKLLAASIGVNGDWEERAEKLVKTGVQILTVDIAHGHSQAMVDVVKTLKARYAQVDVIAGNVATAEGVLDLIEAGADSVKVGIGPGSMCTTRIITGCGVPQLSAIAVCAEAAAERNVPLIADGGIRTSGDIVKAFAAGASVVMLGGMLSGTIETPGEIKSGRKKYRGMASKAAQVSWRGELPEGMAPEGESTSVAVKGHVKDVILEICGGIRSGMSYVNARALGEIKEKARFIQMTSAGAHESRAHGL
jgi:IMP dehydrogenase